MPRPRVPRAGSMRAPGVPSRAGDKLRADEPVSLRGSSQRSSACPSAHHQPGGALGAGQPGQVQGGCWPSASRLLGPRGRELRKPYPELRACRARPPEGITAGRRAAGLWLQEGLGRLGAGLPCPQGSTRVPEKLLVPEPLWAVGPAVGILRTWM